MADVLNGLQWWTTHQAVSHKQCCVYQPHVSANSCTEAGSIENSAWTVDGWGEWDNHSIEIMLSGALLSHWISCLLKSAHKITTSLLFVCKYCLAYSKMTLDLHVQTYYFVNNLHCLRMMLCPSRGMPSGSVTTWTVWYSSLHKEHLNLASQDLSNKICVMADVMSCI